jgi:hypothetical protein
MIESADVAHKLCELERCIEADKRALLRDENPSLEQIAERDALLHDVREMNGLICGRAGQREDLRKKAARRAVLLPLCGELLEKLKAAALELKQRQKAVEEWGSAVSIADGALNEHLGNPLELYPTTKQVRQWNLRKQELESVLAERRGKLRAACDEQNKQVLVYQAAKESFDAASFQERQCAPKESSSYEQNNRGLSAVPNDSDSFR